MRVRRERTSCVTSLMILALSLGDRVVNHFASLCVGGEREREREESCRGQFSKVIADGMCEDHGGRRASLDGTHHFTLP